jgi:hypothetical protein
MTTKIAFALCCAVALGASAQAATITINGTPDSIPGELGLQLGKITYSITQQIYRLDTRDLLVQRAAAGF